MKISNAARLIFWLAAILAIGILVRAESSEKRANMANTKSAPLRIVDQNGRPAINGVPSATSQIVDVMVGPGFTFAPDTVNISVGDTVRWTWADSGHSVSSGPQCVPDSQFCSPNDTGCFPGTLSNSGTVYQHTFNTPGSYSYICIAHCSLGMAGVVNVTGSCAQSGWSTAAPLPTPGVRLAGVYFPANGKFYAMGGRASDTAGNEFTHPFEYDPNTNTWTTKGATYPDNMVNNIACGVLTDAGTPYIYCAGGSVVSTPTVTTGRVFRYDPVTDTISPVAAPWPAAGTTVIPGGFTVFQNKLYILGGFDTVTGGGQGINQIWEITPSPAAWVQKPTNIPVTLGYIPTTTIGSLIYTGGGSDITAGLLTDTTNSFVYDPVANTIGTITAIPRATGETRALNFNGKMLVMGGGRTAPNPSNEVDAYDPVSNTWAVNTPVPAFANARRNFPTDTDGTCRIWLAGGYDSTGLPTALAERFCCGGAPSPTPTATGTPSATPTCPPGGSPGPWTQAAPVGIDHYGGFMDSDGTFAYEGGGYSFSAGGTINQFGKFNPATNTWTPLAPVPDLANAEASGVYAPNVNKLFVFGGDDPTTGTVVNTTRIYDIATNTWSTGTPMPDVRAFMGSGYFNGKIYLVGGYSTGNVDPSFGQVWEYDPVANTFNTSRMNMPATLGGPGFGIINGHIYIAGGRDMANTNLNTLYDYDIVANTWTTRANLPSGINVPGSAVIGGKLWVFGGGNPFTGPGTMPTSGNRGVRAWLKRLFTPDTTNALQVYDPATNSWTSGPTLNQQRSFPAGTGVGNTAVAVGGYTGSSTTTSVEINVAGGGCASPTPTVPPSATPTGSPTCTPGGTPGPWSTASPYPIPDVRYGFAQTATHFYVFGGVSNGTRVPDVNRMVLATGMWESRAAMPFTSEAPTCALMASTGIVYCTEGDTGSGFASYNIATNTWTPLASIPGGDHYGSASGAFNGKVFVAGGTTGIVNAVQVYDVATNAWSAGTAAPSAFLLAGYQQVGQFLYVVGGFSSTGPNGKV